MDNKDTVIILLIYIILCGSISAIYGLFGLAIASLICLIATLVVCCFIFKADN